MSYGDEKITELERIADLEKKIRELLKRIADLESSVEGLQNP